MNQVQNQNRRKLPQLDQMNPVKGLGSGPQTSLYKDSSNEAAVFINPGGQITLTDKVYAYLGRPSYIRFLEYGPFVAFVPASTVGAGVYKVNFGGKHHTSASAVLNSSRLCKQKKLTREGYKSKYAVTLENGAAYLETDRPPLTWIEHVYVKHSK